MFRKKMSFIKPARIVFFACLLLANYMAAGQQTEKQSASHGGKKVATLEEFLKVFKLEYKNTYFSFASAQLKGVKVGYRAFDSVTKNDPDKMLEEVLSAAGLVCEKIDGVYIIKQGKILVRGGNSFSNSINFNRTILNEVTVKGKVTTTAGPLENATVTEKGTSNSTITDGSGNFVLNVSNKNAVLVVTSIGYTKVEIALNGRTDVTIEMGEDAKELEGVVVTALGIAKPKKSLAYSVATVKSDDITKGANPNLLKSLDGKVSGVNFTNLSSDPTSSVLVNIRGTTAIPTTSDRNVTLKGQPLYVIDGVPVGTQTFTSKDGVDFGNILSQLNPEDIDNVTILKGGSAGALYGAEGGNGVVMITTKSGKNGKKGLGVSYSISSLWDKGYQFMDEQQLFGQGERAFEWQYDNTDTWGPKLDGSFTSDYWDVKEQAWKTKAMVSANENRLQQYLQTGNTTTNNINVTGNYDKGSFRLSMSNMDNKGVMPNTKTNQKSITLNTEYRISPKMRVSVTSSYIRTFSPNKANSTGSNSVINNLLFNFPANLQALSEMRNYWLNGFEGIQQNGAIMKDNGVDVDTDNPWWTTYEKIHRFSRDNYFGKLQFDWQLSKNFSLLARTGMESVKENYELRQSWGKTAMASKFTQGDGAYVVGDNSSLSINSDLILTYNKEVGKFSVNASVGGNYGYSNNNSLQVNANKLATPALFSLQNAMPGQLLVDNDNTSWGTGQSYSAYAMATIGYNNMLFLDVTGRNDWKGILGEEKISYFYPSASLSWVVSETVKMPESINLLKARLAWADVGNGLVRRRSVDTYSYDASNWGAAKTVSISTSLVDPDIKAMHSVTQEAGLDLWMFNSRLRFDFTYFIKTQKDQIDNIPTVQGTGYAGMLTNIGDVRNKGFEWGLGLTPVKSKNFNWDLNFSFTHYKATIVRLSGKFAPNGYVFADYDGKTRVRIAEGEEIGNIYEQNPILRVKTGKYAGMALLDKQGGEFQISGDERDRGKLGNFNPSYILGVNTTLRYKQFALTLVGSLRVGGKYVSVNQQYLESNGRAFTTLGSGDNNPWWSGGRTGELGGHPWPAEGASTYAAINNNNDDQRSDWNDASYAKGVFINPNLPSGTTPTDADYIVNGADPNNTFYQIPYNSYGDVIWDFAATRTYDATNFKLREVSLAYTLPTSIARRLTLNNITFSFIGRNMLQWNKSGRHEDPESAFSGVGVNQGILRATLPSIRSMGFKLSVEF